jgi:hypothetical protein
LEEELSETQRPVKGLKNAMRRKASSPPDDSPLFIDCYAQALEPEKEWQGHLNAPKWAHNPWKQLKLLGKL